MCSVSSLTLGTSAPHAHWTPPFFLSQTHPVEQFCPLSVLTSLWCAPVTAKSDLHHGHLACAVLTKFPFVPLCAHLITGPCAAHPSFSRVLGWLLSISALLLNRVCVFHLLNSSTSQDPCVAFVFSLVMCSMSELIPSQGILSTVI